VCYTVCRETINPDWCFPHKYFKEYHHGLEQPIK